MPGLNAAAAPVILSALAMSAIVALRYLASSGAFAWVTHLRHPGLYAGQARQIRAEVKWSLISALIYGVPAGVVAWGWSARGWTLIYADIGLWPLWYWPLSVLAYLVLHDCWFYWTHRLMHRPWWFARLHAVHHDSRPPTAWAAMSFHPWEALTGAVVIPVLVFIVPIHVGALATVLAVMTVMGVTNHMGWDVFPRFIVDGPAGRWLITATHHQRHHDRYQGNFGLYFRCWDRMCGTDHGLGTFRRSESSSPDR